MKFVWSVLALFFCASTWAQQTTTNQWAIAEQRIFRLPPADFPQLPRDVLRYLTERRLMIPQSFGVPTPHNVIVGQFRQRGQTDYAVLASRDGVSKF